MVAAPETVLSHRRASDGRPGSSRGVSSTPGGLLNRLHEFLPRGRQLPDEVWTRRHAGLVNLLRLNVPLLVVFGCYRQHSLTQSLVACSPLVVLAIAAAVPRLPRCVRCGSVALGLAGGASILVYFSGGAIEAHFQYFVVIAFLSLYQAWLPFLIAIGFVLFEHGIVGVLAPGAVYDHNLMPGMSQDPWKWAFIHAGFLIAAGFANVLAWRLTEHEALHDALTGLPNRVLFIEAVQHACDRQPRTQSAMLFIDLDNFKDTNDGFGHESGDHLLRAIAARLRARASAGDTVARIGGDEFAVVLNGIYSEREGLDTAARYLAAFTEPFALNGLSVLTTASIGLVLISAESNPITLMRDADLAMYDAKRCGGGQISSYRPEMFLAVMSRATLEAELTTAVHRGEFIVHYQPLVGVSSGDIVGTEALVRWQHPTRGLVPPADFIPAAEQSGLIIALGGWVLRTACEQTAAWHRAHPDRPPLTVSVNLSPRQLADPHLIDTVATALSDSGLAAEHLCLEITEGAVINDFSVALPKLRALRSIGVSLALDDFGTGYSSLSYLRQLPVDSLKIDRSFITDLAAGHDHRIVLAIIDLAHALGMSVTAEGVETEDQLVALQNLASNLAQGYLFGAPMRPEQMTQLLDDQDPTRAHPLLSDR